MSTNKFLIYNTLDFPAMEFLINIISDNISEDEFFDIERDIVKEILDISEKNGFSGDIIKAYISYFLAYNENTFSLIYEKKERVDSSISIFAKNDLNLIKEIFDFDFSKINKGMGLLKYLISYKNEENFLANRSLMSKILGLREKLSNSKTSDEFFENTIEFYKMYGCGEIGLNKGFRIKENRKKGIIVPEIEPVGYIEKVYLDDLIGYEVQKKRLIDNTENFVNGINANNVLLYGDSGTGKSSSIKAILNEYYDRGLRMIEVYKHQFRSLLEIIEKVKDRNYKFIIYMDDLSFEDYEIEYKYLKAVIEGGLGKKPDNVLIYATSNRRHLVREKWSDKEDRREDLHTSDTVEEKLSLVNRFGVTIAYLAPTRKEYEHIIKVLSEKHGITIPEDRIIAEANKWLVRNGSLSGRSANQFVSYLLGQDSLKV